MNQTETELTISTPDNICYSDKYKYLLKLARDCLYDINNGERVCVETNKLMRVIMVLAPDINVEWNKCDECYYCYK